MDEREDGTEDFGIGEFAGRSDSVEYRGPDKVAGCQAVASGMAAVEQEPPGQTPLLGLDNVVFTPHAAGGDTLSRDEMALSAAEAIVDLSRGAWPAEKVVNPAVRETFRWQK